MPRLSRLFRFLSAPAPARTDGFLDLCRRSGLLTDTELRTACAAVQERGDGRGEKDAVAALCDYLIAEKMLTSWQCEKLRDGRFKGFFLGPYKLLGHVCTDEIHAIYLGENLHSHRQDHLAVLPQSKCKPEPVGYFYENGVYFLIVDSDVGRA